MIAAVDVAGEAWALIAGVGGGAAKDRFVRHDPATGQTLATIPLPTANAHRVVAGEGALWVPWNDAVLRVDRVTAAVETIPLCCSGSREAAVGYGSLWLACKDAGTVLRIDAAARQVVATIATEPGAHHIAIGEEAVWVTNYQEHRLADRSRVQRAHDRERTNLGRDQRRRREDRSDHERDRRPAQARRRALLYGLVFADGSRWASATWLRRVYRITPAMSARG